MSLLKTNEIQNYNGSSLTLTASTVSTSAQLNTGGNISVTGSLNVSDDSTTRTNLGLGTIATQDSDSITVTGGTATLGALTVSGSDSGDLVRITQTGSGNAFVVEDETNPDSTPFVVNSSGNVGIGTSSPSKKLIVNSAPDTTNPSNGVYFEANNPGLTASQINSTSSGLGVVGMVTNFGGDFHIRSFWGVCIDKGAGNLGSGAGNTVNADSRTFSIRQYAGATTWNTQFSVNGSGNCTISGSLSKGSGSFRINHPLKPDTHQLVHSFIEGPQADLIYRGKVELVAGLAEVNIDTVAGMTEGTFVALNREVQCFTSNESDWDAVRGFINGNILTIECENAESTATISWLVIGERQDQHMYDTDWTDENGKVIVEPEKTLED
jgi:hypothetical protein